MGIEFDILALLGFGILEAREEKHSLRFFKVLLVYLYTQAAFCICVRRAWPQMMQHCMGS